MLLAERLGKVLTREDGRSSLVATFIHRVVPTLETISSLRSRKSNKAAWLAAWKDQRIFFNRTPIGMATQVPLDAAVSRLPSCFHAIGWLLGLLYPHNLEFYWLLLDLLHP